MEREPFVTQDLINSIRGGDRAAFDELFKHVGGKVYVYIYNQMGDRLRAVLDPEDLMQEVYARGFTAFDEFDESGEFDGAEAGSFAAWLIGIARNCIRSLYRHHYEQAKRDPRRAVALDAFPDATELAIDPAAPDLSPSRIVARDQEVLRVADAVAQLEDDDRRLILMHIYEGKPLEAVAKALDVPRTTLSYRMSRALRQLGTTLRDA